MRKTTETASDLWSLVYRPTSATEWPTARQQARLMGAAVTIWLVLRLAYNSVRELVPDEAYYWVWSRHLAGGYLDHPPMVALVIRAGTELFGSSEFGVRFFAAVLAAATAGIVIYLTHATSHNARATAWAALILLASPLLAVLGTVITPDTPAAFFGSAAMAVAVLLFSPSNAETLNLTPGQSAGSEATEAPPRIAPLLWIAFGLLMGLAVASKYTTVLLGAAVALAVITSPQGRRQLLTPWPWISLLIAIAVFSPVIQWNQSHDWASFRFQLQHGLEAGDLPPWVTISSYLGGQAAVSTPVLFILGLIVLFDLWKRVGTLGTADRILLFAATLPLVFFLYSSIRKKVEPNWPSFANLPWAILTARYLAAKPEGRRAEWGRIGIIVAACSTVFLHIPEVLYLAPPIKKIPGKWEDLFGWRQMGQKLDELTAGTTTVVYASSYEYAAEASFYMQGQPQVWTWTTNRPTEFDYLPGRPDPADTNRFIFFRKWGGAVPQAAPAADFPAELSRFSISQIQRWETTALGRPVRRREFLVVVNPAATSNPNRQLSANH